MDLVQDIRSTAVALGHTEYRVAKVTLTFDDLDTAIAAIPVVTDRVDSLVTTWQTSRTQFITAAETTQLPTNSAGAAVKDGYKTAYSDAYEARVDAEFTQATKQTAYNTAQGNTTVSRDKRDIHCGYKTRLTELNGLVDVANTAPALNPAIALQNAITALNAAADQFERATRAVNGLTGTAQAGSTATVVKLGVALEGAYIGGILALTDATDGHKEVRAIIAVGATNATVSPAFSFTPAAGADSFEIRLFTDILPTNDYGAAAAAANKAQAALNSYQSSSGLAAKIAEHLSYATTQCATSNTDLNTKITAENSALSELESAQADVTSAQSSENAAAAELLVVCPDIDLTSLQ